MTIDIEIKRLKAQLGGRNSAVQVRDANVERQHVTSTFGRLVYTTRLKFTHAGRKAEILMSEDLGCISMFGEFDVPRFTINAKDRSGFGSASIGNVQIDSSVLEVFTEDGQLTSPQSTVLSSAELARLIMHHQFREGEALHFYRNCIVLYVRREDISSELVYLLNAIASIVPPCVNVPESIELPQEFSKLEDISQEWAIGDDLERSEKIQNATGESLKHMLTIIEPELEAINSYLDRHRDNPPSEALATLARLAETAMEVKVTLSRREVRGSHI